MEIKIGTIVNDRYEIQKLIGQGATAQVFHAKDLVTNDDKALKIELEQTGSQQISHLDRRFSLEAKALQQFNNKNIVKVYDFFSWGNRKIIVMELVRGKPVNQILKEKGKIPCKTSAKYAIQVLNALSDIHKKNIFHRDLKPSNIMLTFDDQIKLMDFGVAKVSTDQELTKQDAIIGTIDYMAPEIIKHQKVSRTSEIWALGVMLYKMATGILPFTGTDINIKAHNILNKDPILPSNLNPDVDKHFEQIIMKMLSKDYYNRYRSAESAIDALMDYINQPKKTKSLLENKEKPSRNINIKNVKLFVLLGAIGLTTGIIAIILAVIP